MSFVEVMVGEHTPIKDLIMVIKSTCNPDVLNKIENLSQSNNELVIAELDWRWEVLLAQKFILSEGQMPERLRVKKTIARRLEYKNQKKNQTRK